MLQIIQPFALTCTRLATSVSADFSTFVVTILEAGFPDPEPLDDLVAPLRFPHDLLHPESVEFRVREAVVLQVVSGLLERQGDACISVGELAHQKERPVDAERRHGGHQLLHSVFPRPVVEGQGDLPDEGVPGSDAPTSPLGIQGPYGYSHNRYSE